MNITITFIVSIRIKKQYVVYIPLPTIGRRRNFQIDYRKEWCYSREFLKLNKQNILTNQNFR